MKNIVSNVGFFCTNNSQIGSFDQVYIITKKCNMLSIFNTINIILLKKMIKINRILILFHNKN